jgi:hypothetical protein
MTPFTQTKLNLPKPKKFIAGCMLKYGVTRAQAKVQYNALRRDRIFVNDTYQVNVSDQPPWNEMGTPIIHLSIKRLDKGPARDWRHFQQIKNELVGPNHEAFELYPNDDRLVDAANQYHLWCFATPDIGMPVGFPSRGVEYVPSDPTVTQRPEGEEIEPTEQITIDQILEAAAMMDAADVPEDGRMVSLIDPDTGQYVDTDTNPERVMEIIQKFVGEQEAADVVDIKERTAEAEGPET